MYVRQQILNYLQDVYEKEHEIAEKVAGYSSLGGLSLLSKLSEQQENAIFEKYIEILTRFHDRPEVLKNQRLEYEHHKRTDINNIQTENVMITNIEDTTLKVLFNPVEKWVIITGPGDTQGQQLNLRLINSFGCAPERAREYVVQINKQRVNEQVKSYYFNNVQEWIGSKIEPTLTDLVDLVKDMNTTIGVQKAKLFFYKQVIDFVCAKYPDQTNAYKKEHQLANTNLVQVPRKLNNLIHGVTFLEHIEQTLTLKPNSNIKDAEQDHTIPSSNHP